MAAVPRKPKQSKHKGVFERDKGSNIWLVRFTSHDGKRVSRCIGTFSDACNFVDEQKVRVRRGIMAPIPSHRGVRYSQIVSEAIARSDKSRSDHRNFVQRLNVTVEQFGNRMADTIQPSEFAGWFDEMEDDREWSNATINRYRAAMSKAYKLALADGKVSRNPVRLVPAKPENNGRLRFLSPEEEERLRAAIKRECYIRQLDIALNTGMREGEQFSITRDQIDFEQKYVYLSKTKNGSDRYVSLNSTALTTFRELKAEHEHREFDENATLFLSWQHKPMADPREWFSIACEDAKIVGVTWHTLRHTFASRLVMKCVDLKLYRT